MSLNIKDPEAHQLAQATGESMTHVVKEALRRGRSAEVIVDTSALVAILYREPEAAAFAQLIYDADVRRISGPPFIPLNPPFGRMSGRSD
jgi:hypothetical protein